ncbi:Hypothetical protein I595_18 [Croceitalea dokdonensis DOKDO 023]|uniref:DUF547 domain-containing protein n=1 Tax=Croceitalea dokdonensis DOKDO 023 TaxID=1300341 RepID=A0A0N8H4E1_9FLAO|nr:DUF547 domain-containing protein [Croceitalea dokdonensis]KPM33116.1 Hypothetical protein I595_18 [Croceitalea dokdonensis DOKDO 023]
MKNHFFTIIFLLLLSCCKVKEATFSPSGGGTTELNELSEQFLKKIQQGEGTAEIQEQLANTSLKQIQKTLVTDQQRYAFWLNIYNAYIQVFLRNQPELYKDRRDFFSKEQINIAGQTISFSKIEHGIIRKSQWELGLGYFRKIFPDALERKLRVSKRDYRVHFALNCGAKDCPPVAIYSPERLEEQLNQGTERYLKETSLYDSSSNTVKVTALFSWFRGDFGGERGVGNILVQYGIIPSAKGVNISYKNYDWTLALDNFITL